MTEPLNQNFVQWTRNAIGMMKIGGSWGIPRSGVIVHRTGEKTVRIDRSIAYGPEELLESYLEAAGYTVEAEKK